MRKRGGYQIQTLRAALVAASVLTPLMVAAEPVTVRHPEGTLHGFLTLRTLDDRLLADGDATQTVRGDRVTMRLAFAFKDGSFHEQTTVYSQRQHLQLISDRVVQKGPAFPQPIDMSIDAASGRVTVRHQDGINAKTETAVLAMPPDLANGLVSKMLMNLRADAMPQSFSYIAATPQPRMVKLLVFQAGRDPYAIAGSPREAMHYVLKVEIGGLAGVLAPIFGKQPPDSHVWIAGGDVPAFLKAEQPLYAGGPVWRIELTSPTWPKAPPAPTAQSVPTAKANEGKRRPPA